MNDPPVQRLAKARARLAPGLDPARYFAVGTAADIIRRCEEYIRAGVSKFVLIPLAQGDADLFDQTERLIAEVLPAVR